ncbi:MAG TPA: helix-turn-helix transcriptional regulator [Caulobacteraceae bacterium]
MSDAQQVKRGPEAVDVHVGARVRLRRKQVGKSQEELAAALGLTFQQVQKYERGSNRISASKLYAIAKALTIDVAWFFEDLDQAIRPGVTEGQARTHAMLQSFDMGQLAEMFVGFPEPVRREAMASATSLLKTIKAIQSHHCTAGDAKPLIEAASQR